MFSCEICEIFKNTYFEEHLRTTTSVGPSWPLQSIFKTAVLLVQPFRKLFFPFFTQYFRFLFI